MLSMYVVYDHDGNVLVTMDYAAVRDEAGAVIGFVDFEAHEVAGGKMRDINDVQALDAPIPLEVAREVLGRDPAPGESITLAPDHPFRVVHDRVAGSGTWPEWLGADVHGFRVEKGEDGRIRALVHRGSGFRRERSVVERAVAQRVREAAGAPADVRDLLGGPGRPLVLDDEGKVMVRERVVQRLPMIGIGEH